MKCYLTNSNFQKSSLIYVSYHFLICMNYHSSADICICVYKMRFDEIYFFFKVLQFLYLITSFFWYLDLCLSNYVSRILIFKKSSSLCILLLHSNRHHLHGKKGKRITHFVLCAPIEGASKKKNPHKMTIASIEAAYVYDWYVKRKQISVTIMVTLKIM